VAKGKNEPLPHLASVGRPLLDILADPFSGVTRGRQISLLIAASVSWLLSMGLAKVAEVALGDSKFHLNGPPQLPVWLAFAVTLYLLVTYCLYVATDLTMANTKYRWTQETIGDVVATSQKLSTAAQNALQDRVASLLAEQAQIRAEWSAKLEQKRARIKEIYSSLDAVRSAPAELLDELSKLEESERAISDELVNRTIAYAQAIEKTPTEADITRAAMTQFDLVIGTLSRFRMLKKWRRWLEIVFPIAYAALALLWTLRQVIFA